MFEKVAPFLLVLSALQAGTCITCHPKEARDVRHSLHFTLQKALTITHHAWSIEGNVTLQTLPHPPKTIKKVTDLVDDFLRRKCLRCHLPPQDENSCLACHHPHPPKVHFARAKATMDKCLACHNKEYIGTDFLGWFPKDYDRSYRAPLSPQGTYPPVKYGIDYHHLAPDVHYEAGLTCTDCHTRLHPKAKTLSCKACHPHPSSSNHPAYHKRIACIACHASWQINSYELSLFRDDTAHYKQWRRLTLQEDPWLRTFLQKALHSPTPPPPRMPDFIDGTLHKGIWYSGYRFRRWEDFYLAVDRRDGKIKLYRPLYQYRISYRDANGSVVFDDVHTLAGRPIAVWLPYAPHTIGKQAKSCEMCHDNPLLLPAKSTGTVLDLKHPARSDLLWQARMLDAKERAKLHSQRYRKIRAKMLIRRLQMVPSPQGR